MFGRFQNSKQSVKIELNEIEFSNCGIFAAAYATLLWVTEKFSNADIRVKGNSGRSSWFCVTYVISSGNLAQYALGISCISPTIEVQSHISLAAPQSIHSYPLFNWRILLATKEARDSLSMGFETLFASFSGLYIATSIFNSLLKHIRQGVWICREGLRCL